MLLDNLGATALHLAALNRHVDVIKYMIDLQKFDITSKTSEDSSVLDYAARYGNLEVCQFLLKLGVLDDVEARQAAYVLLMVVLLTPENKLQAQTVQLLLNYGACMTIGEGRPSILHWATHERTRQNTRNVLMRYVAKREHLNPSLSETEQRLIEDSDCYRKYYKMCSEELQQMKDAKFYNNVSAFNILTDTHKVISGYARNEELLKAFEEANFGNMFPIYGSAMIKRFCTAVERKTLRLPAAKILGDLLQFNDPIHPVNQKILSYLEDADFKSFEM